MMSVDLLTQHILLKNTLLGMFADDIVLSKTLQSDVMTVVDWVETIDLRLNKEKTKCMLLTRGKKSTSVRPQD